MMRDTRLLFCLGLSMTAGSLLPAQPSAKSNQAEVDRLFSAFNTHTPGCAVGVASRGSVVLTAGYGMADLERNVPITPETVFESGSVAKQFTAAALHLLDKQGKLSLDDPFRKYLPELPNYGAPLTIRHVISHVSGLREWRPLALYAGLQEGTHVLTNRDILRLAARQRALNFDPGTAYSYSNTGYALAPILVERALANGQSFQDFTRQAIFEPLRMTHTRWRDDFRAIVPNRALAYEPGPNGSWIQETPIYNIIGPGGLFSTVGDWLLWNENFTHATVGGAELLQRLQTPATLANGKSIPYAAGLHVGTVDGLREVSHAGATGGYRTWLGRYPNEQLSVAVMCNAASANPTSLGRAVARLWTGAKPTSPVAPPAVARGLYRNLRDNSVLDLRNGGALPPRSELDGDIRYEQVEPAAPTSADLAAYAGKYTSPEMPAGLIFAVTDNALTLAIGEDPPIKLRPTYRDAFDAPPMSYRFLRDPSGKVTALSAGTARAWDMRFNRVAD